MIKHLIFKDKLGDKEKLAFFRFMLAKEMELLKEYTKERDIESEYTYTLLHLSNTKKLNIARIVGIIEYYDKNFAKFLMFSDPNVRNYVSYYLDFIKNNPYGAEVFDSLNLFGNWDFIKYKLKILFPDISLSDIEKYKFKRKEFIEFVKQRTKEKEAIINGKLNKATWYENTPYLEVEQEMTREVHIEEWTEEDWAFFKSHINGRKYVFVNENGSEKLKYIDVNLTDDEIEHYKNNKEGLIELLSSRYSIGKDEAKQILIKAGMHSGIHTIAPTYSDIYTSKQNTNTPVFQEQKGSHTEDPANVIMHISGYELKYLSFYELIYDKVEREVQKELDYVIRTSKKILGKLFGIFYKSDPLMAEAIITIKPEKLTYILEALPKVTVRNKAFNLFENETAWKMVKERITTMIPSINLEQVEKFRAKRKEFIEYLNTLGITEDRAENILEQCGWYKSEEIPPFARQIGP